MLDEWFQLAPSSGELTRFQTKESLSDHSAWEAKMVTEHGGWRQS